MAKWIFAGGIIVALYCPHRAITSNVPGDANAPVPLLARQNISNNVFLILGNGSALSDPLIDVRNDLQLLRSDITNTLADPLMDVRKELQSLRTDITNKFAHLNASIRNVSTGLDAVKVDVLLCGPRRSSSLWPVGIMHPNWEFFANEKFCSEDGKFCLFLHDSGNLVLYDTILYRTLWNSRIIFGRSCESSVKVEPSGEVVLYIRGARIWSAGSADIKEGRDVRVQKIFSKNDE
ncbi:uncharacterized protein LOC129586960 isoform X2 [Paramacrobiotus metropolitanus]|uniref:uncharacterized protein LOC129586960 isoform X2 n=1 Tax=Paramacrobiotus metropolitanus TaxID=2943436 RepID=UPI002445E5CF|nr:uncharacterized protein LOC129586960 isoform X2 [Paramacrobiotus metropolitanus]